MPFPPLRRFAAALPVAGLALLGACGGGATAQPELESKPVAIDSGVKPGDCPEALRRAAAKPDLDVDRLPAPVAFKPAPIPRRMPPSVMRKGYAEVRITVLVDTLGKADMRTFTVVKSTHPWLTQNVKSAVAKWTFTPAELAGCKVPRVFKWAAVAGRPPAAS